jgi:hypothetical protein
MPLSAVQISNLALARIGILQGIDDLDEASDEARACKLAFDACLDGLMEAHDWPFISNRTAGLGLVETDPSDAWAYSYRLPSDYLMAGSLGDGIPFTLSSDATGGLLLTSINPATLTYRARITDTALLPHGVAMALVGRLSVEIGPALSRSDAVVARAQQRATMDLETALANRQNEPEQNTHREAEAISGRE